MRGDDGKGDGGRVAVVMETLARRGRVVEDIMVLVAAVVVVDVPVEDVDDGEEGCADCGGVKVNGACSAIFG